MKILFFFLFFFPGLTQSLQCNKNECLRSKDQMPMVTIAEGSFFMGSENPLHPDWEKPVLYVKMDAFWIDRFEVSFRQYQICASNNGCLPLKENDNPDFPVYSVSWTEARSYCQWVGGDLPTEAQWEYAARGENSILYPFATTLHNRDTKETLTNLISWPKPLSTPQSVQSTAALRLPSKSGIYQMAGNVSEWTLDHGSQINQILQPRPLDEEQKKQKRATNPLWSFDSEYRIFKGASWKTAFPALQRASFRDFANQIQRRKDLGFRCVIPAKNLSK